MTRSEVEDRIRAALDVLNAPQPDYYLPRQYHANAAPYVEGEGPYFNWIRKSKGELIEERVVDGPEVVFLTLEHLTMTFARDLEKQTRTRKRAGLLTRLRARGEYGAGLDDYSRKTWMDAHVRLMSAVQEGWGTRVRLKYDLMLKKYPLTPDEKRDARLVDLSRFGIQ